MAAGKTMMILLAVFFRVDCSWGMKKLPGCTGAMENNTRRDSIDDATSMLTTCRFHTSSPNVAIVFYENDNPAFNFLGLKNGILSEIKSCENSHIVVLQPSTRALNDGVEHVYSKHFMETEIRYIVDGVQTTYNSTAFDCDVNPITNGNTQEYNDIVQDLKEWSDYGATLLQ